MSDSSIVIIDINDFDGLGTAIHKHNTIRACQAKTVDPQTFGFKHFGMKAWMPGVLAKKSCLFSEGLFQSMISKKRMEAFGERQNLHS